MIKVNSELTRVEVMVNIFVEVLSKEGKLQMPWDDSAQY